MVPDSGELVIEYIKHHQLDVLRSIIVVTAAPNAIRTALRGEYPEPICKFVAKPFDMHEFVQLVHPCKETCDGDHVPSYSARLVAHTGFERARSNYPPRTRR